MYYQFCQLDFPIPDFIIAMPGENKKFNKMIAKEMGAFLSRPAIQLKQDLYDLTVLVIEAVKSKRLQEEGEFLLKKFPKRIYGLCFIHDE